MKRSIFDLQLELKEEETPKEIGKQLLVLIKWIVIGVLTGCVGGVIGTGFSLCISKATAFRAAHDQMIFLLPFAGLLIVFCYRHAHMEKDRGTNLVLDVISKGEFLPLRTTPLIILATTVTHLFGGSAGREGAALQMGGSLGYNIGRFLKLGDNDRKILTMCGMSAGFAALFRTPLAAAFMAMEVTSIGVFYYAALVPCVLASVTADRVAELLGAEGEQFAVHIVPEITPGTAAQTMLLAILCGFLAMLFCRMLHKSGKLYKKYFPNPYLRIFVGGCLVAALTLLSGTRIYNGAGMDTITLAVQGHAGYTQFLWKMVFTALTLGAGYKGGEIVPSLFVGASFGSIYAKLFGLNPALCSAIGMGALFCGVTNCPITSLFICFELFGFTGMPYYLIAVAFAYALSGYGGLYSSQKIMYSKFENRYINHGGSK